VLYCIVLCCVLCVVLRCLVVFWFVFVLFWYVVFWCVAFCFNVRFTFSTGRSHFQTALSNNKLYTITRFNFHVPTCSVWEENLFRETGVVHRITSGFSYFRFYLCFVYSFYSWYKENRAIVSQTTKSFFSQKTQSLHRTPSHRSRNRLLSQWTASVRCLLPTISSFKSLSVHKPSYLLPIVLEHTLRDWTYNVWLWAAPNWHKQT
jgi:hypothetical protein